MGNKNTKPACLKPREDVGATTTCSTKRLSEDEAQEIALLWVSHLQGFVTLTTQWPIEYQTAAFSSYHHSCSDYTIVDCVEWIEFNFENAPSRDLKRLVRMARAATVTWFALSCCFGFGGKENPIFWKRVLSAYMPESIEVVRHHGDDTNRNRFFDHPDRPFPRIRFHGFRNSLPLEQWWKRSDQRPQDDMLRDVLKRLEPFIRQSRWNRTIPVSIRVMYVRANPVQLAKRFLAHASDQDEPHFQLDHVVYHRYNASNDLASTSRMRLCTSIILSTLIQQDDQANNRIPCAMKCLFAQQQGRPEPIPHLTIQTLNLRLPSIATEIGRVSVWCSVLPHTRSIESVQAVAEDARYRLDIPKAAWLGYAIFHPDTATYHSSVENLSLRVTTTMVPTVHSFLSMASNNNLLVTHGMKAVSASYTKARIRSASTVFDEINGTAIYTFSSECWITLCQITPSQPYLDEWACIVLPGHGIAWVLAESILELQELAPAPSCVRRLQLMIGDYGIEIAEETKAVLLDVLLVMGEHLTYLQIDSRGPLDTETVQSALRLCPNLTSLRIHHDGSCWTEPYLASTPMYPRLQELELTIPHTLVAVEGPQLAALKAFRVVSGEADRFNANRSIVQAMLLRYPHIQYLNWHVRFIPISYIRLARSYDKSTKHSNSLLDPDATGAYDYVVLKISLDARLAFLSVVRQTHLLSALGQFPRELVERIFDFSSNIVPRFVDICDIWDSTYPGQTRQQV